jgi:heme-degrading monooxygenase HmoA
VGWVRVNDFETVARNRQARRRRSLHRLSQERHVPRLASLAGFIRATILRREVAEGTQFQVVTVWESLDAIGAFSGSDADRAVVPPAAQAMMVEFDRRAVHYEIAFVFEGK